MRLHGRGRVMSPLTMLPWCRLQQNAYVSHYTPPIMTLPIKLFWGPIITYWAGLTNTAVWAHPRSEWNKKSAGKKCGTPLSATSYANRSPLMKGSREGKQHTSPPPSTCTWALRKPGRIQTKTNPAAQNSSAICSCGEALIRMYPSSWAPFTDKEEAVWGKQGAVKQNQPVETKYWPEKCLILWNSGQSCTCSLYLSWPQAQPATL